MTEHTERSKGGRPSLYSDAVVEEIAERLSAGQTFKQITDDPNMPSLRTVMQWAADKPGFRTILTRARAAQVESLLGIMWEEALKADTENVRVADLRVKTIQWLLARYDPRKYSERVLAELAKVPEPVAAPEPDIDPKLLSYEERELYLQLQETARRRKEAMLIEHEPTEGEDNDGSEPSAGDDQSGDPAGG